MGLALNHNFTRYEEVKLFIISRYADGNVAVGTDARGIL